MTNPLIQKLERHGILFQDERQILQQIIARTVVYKPREEIAHGGSSLSYSSLIVSGFAVRQNHSPEGQRQITALHIPGDFADLHSFLLKPLDDGVVALTTCTVALVAHSDLKEITRCFPYLTRVLWFCTLVDAAIHRAWLTTLGRMEARARLAHFLCELRDRLDSVGLVNENSFEMPITQEELGDAFGISTVHVNRVLQELRSEGLITSQGKLMIINDWARLQEAAQYNPEYLHVDQKIERD
ncbi:CRP-like cAMP-binding protein [Microvirga flocculans]|uniref:CRP-like cAMP-binding protein n=1 Tax=Microvirga flocculans TaxID=217168 RepID=A0A7W6ICW8_9HYPH|nr:Crp/Fnr family transcriptional regulator [Microvirga flocculans]MBB4039162.1 CRP-like cAMP-binding protein [Microvirga flocculans]